jgi:hypothetical protein
MKPAVKQYMAEIGAKGGAIGGKATGKVKRRGDSAYYKALSAKAAKARMKK